MRKPNGYGCIKKLSGHRRRPFVFVVSMEGKQKPIGYFATQVEAEIFAADYNKVHKNTSLADHRLTFAELYHRWLNRHIADTAPSASAICGYKNAFRHCSVLHGMPYAEIKYSDYQRIIDDMLRVIHCLLEKSKPSDFQGTASISWQQLSPGTNSGFIT